MSLETFLLWIIVGLIAGWLATAVVGGGYGAVGDIALGIVGAFMGGYIFPSWGWRIGPRGNLPGMVFVAFIGAVILLLLLRLVWYLRSRLPPGGPRGPLLGPPS